MALSEKVVAKYRFILQEKSNFKLNYLKLKIWLMFLNVDCQYRKSTTTVLLIINFCIGMIVVEALGFSSGVGSAHPEVYDRYKAKKYLLLLSPLSKQAKIAIERRRKYEVPQFSGGHSLSKKFFDFSQ